MGHPTAIGGSRPAHTRATPCAGHGSVRDTLAHLVSVQQGWLSWWDRSLSAEEAYRLTLDPADFPDIAALRMAWEKVEKATQAFVSGLSGEDVVRDYVHTLPDGTYFRMPLWQMMLHVANHGTQHHSEVAAMLTSFGHSPGNLDLLFYL
jgi:uncharacterized damage-inducible protein DinB